MTEGIEKIVAPGKMVEVGGIPTAIVDEHHEVFYYWQKSGVKEATLFHVDAHADLNHNASFSENHNEGHFNNLSIENFISAAAHYGIVSSIYWLNPHSSQRLLQDMGTTKDEKGRRRGVTAVSSVSNKITWNLNTRFGKVIDISDVQVGQQLILDIDLDAFSCEVPPMDSRPGYDGTYCFKQRINETVKHLEVLRKPDIITIARSAGYPLVPDSQVDAVQEYLIKKLREAYK